MNFLRRNQYPGALLDVVVGFGRKLSDEGEWEGLEI